jgi:hypothetical protein
MVTRPKKLASLDEVKAMFDPSVHAALDALAQGAEYIVVYEDHDFWSSNLGQRLAVKVGRGCTYASLETALRHAPSWRYVPVAYWKSGEVNDETETA